MRQRQNVQKCSTQLSSYPKRTSGPTDSNLGPTTALYYRRGCSLPEFLVWSDGNISKRVNVSRCGRVGSSLYVFGSALGSCAGVEHIRHGSWNSPRGLRVWGEKRQRGLFQLYHKGECVRPTRRLLWYSCAERGSSPSTSFTSHEDKKVIENIHTRGSAGPGGVLFLSSILS